MQPGVMRSTATAYHGVHTVVVTWPVATPLIQAMAVSVTLLPLPSRSVRLGAWPGTYAGEEGVGTVPSVVYRMVTDAPSAFTGAAMPRPASARMASTVAGCAAWPVMLVMTCSVTSAALPLT